MTRLCRSSAIVGLLSLVLVACGAAPDEPVQSAAEALGEAPAAVDEAPEEQVPAHGAVLEDGAVETAPEQETAPEPGSAPDGQDGFAAAAACRCVQPPALVTEKKRLASIGGKLFGICGDANHNYGYHRAACQIPASDYSRKGAKNRPANSTHAAAIDIGMNWRASRSWLRWLIRQKRAGGVPGISEVIGSYDGRHVMYWSDTKTPRWPDIGVDYYKKMGGSGHQTWTHVAIYRSGTNKDQGILKGWTASCHQPVCSGGRCCSTGYFCSGTRCCPVDRCAPGCPC